MIRAISSMLLLALPGLSLAQIEFTTANAFVECPGYDNQDERLTCYDRYANELNAANKLMQEQSVEPRIDESALALPATRNTIVYEPNHWLFRRFSADDPVFFGYSGAIGDKAARGVEEHIEFDLSFKYPFAESFLAGVKEGAGDWGFRHDLPDRLYFIYNGSYDFQAFSDLKVYDSDPVISKKQNPGFVAEWDINGGYHRLRAGIFHYSNGQTIDVDNDTVAVTMEGDAGPVTTTRSRIDTLMSTYGEEVALEQISRSSYFTQLRYQIQSNPYGLVDLNWYQLQFELRDYIKTDDEIFWAPPPGDVSKIQDYDGLRFLGEGFWPLWPMADNYPNSRWLTRLELKTGTSEPEALENMSTKFTLGWRWGSLIVAANYFNGFGKDLSSYHRRFEYWGIGLEMR